MKRVILFGISITIVVLLSAAPNRFFSPVRAQQFLGAQRAPSITVDRADNIYLATSAATHPAGVGTPGSQIFFTISRDGGASWDNLPQTRNLSNSRGEAFGPSVAHTTTGTNRAYLAFQDNVTGITQAYLIRSKKVAKFKQPFSLSSGAGGGFSPRVAVDSTEGVSVVWGDSSDGHRRVVFVHSPDQAVTFTQPVDISRSPGDAFNPEIAIDSTDAINVTWEDTRSSTSAIMFARSTDHGRTFSEPVRVSTGSGAAAEAHLAIDGSGRIYIVWSEDNQGDSQAFFSRSTDNGRAFSAPINVSNNRRGLIHKPFLAAQGDIVYVAYQNGSIFFEGEITPGSQVYLVKSGDAGLSFADPMQISSANNSRGRAHSPAMTFDSTGKLHIVWIDSTPIGNDEGLLFYASTPNGRQLSTQLAIVAAL